MRSDSKNLHENDYGGAILQTEPPILTVPSVRGRVTELADDDDELLVIETAPYEGEGFSLYDSRLTLTDYGTNRPNILVLNPAIGTIAQYTRKKIIELAGIELIEEEVEAARALKQAKPDLNVYVSKAIAAGGMGMVRELFEVQSNDTIVATGEVLKITRHGRSEIYLENNPSYPFISEEAITILSDNSQTSQHFVKTDWCGIYDPALKEQADNDWLAYSANVGQANDHIFILERMEKLNSPFELSEIIKRAPVPIILAIHRAIAEGTGFGRSEILLLKEFLTNSQSERSTSAKDVLKKILLELKNRQQLDATILKKLTIYLTGLGLIDKRDLVNHPAIISEIYHQATQGQIEAHALGVVVVDFKDANIWLEQGPVPGVKLGDLTNARLQGEAEPSRAFIGTAGYKNFSDGNQDGYQPRADLFSLGNSLMRWSLGQSYEDRMPNNKNDLGGYETACRELRHEIKNDLRAMSLNFAERYHCSPETGMGFLLLAYHLRTLNPNKRTAFDLNSLNILIAKIQSEIISPGLSLEEILSIETKISSNQPIRQNGSNPGIQNLDEVMQNLTANPVDINFDDDEMIFEEEKRTTEDERAFYQAAQAFEKEILKALKIDIETTIAVPIPIKEKPLLQLNFDPEDPTPKDGDDLFNILKPREEEKQTSPARPASQGSADTSRAKPTNKSSLFAAAAGLLIVGGSTAWYLDSSDNNTSRANDISDLDASRNSVLIQTIELDTPTPSPSQVPCIDTSEDTISEWIYSFPNAIKTGQHSLQTFRSCQNNQSPSYLNLTVNREGDEFTILADGVEHHPIVDARPSRTSRTIRLNLCDTINSSYKEPLFARCEDFMLERPSQTKVRPKTSNTKDKQSKRMRMSGPTL